MAIVAALAVNLGLAYACIDNDSCTVAGVVYRCDDCFGDRSCGSIQGTDVCPGVCRNSRVDCFSTGTECDPNDPLDDCLFAGDPDVGDGNKVQCYGSNDDTISGTNGADVICAGAGDDTVNAKGGDDRVNAEAGDDVIDAGGDDDLVEGGLGSDVIDGAGGDDTLYGYEYDTFAGDGDNYIVGGSGADRLEGADGDDIISGGDGSDILAGQTGRDVLKGGNDDDYIISRCYDSPCASQVGDVLGTILCGGDGYDFLYGYGGGHQCLDGGPESDYCGWISHPYPGNSYDVGTAINCETLLNTFDSRVPGCGCE